MKRAFTREEVEEIAHQISSDNPILTVSGGVEGPTVVDLDGLLRELEVIDDVAKQELEAGGIDPHMHNGLLCATAALRQSIKEAM